MSIDIKTKKAILEKMGDLVDSYMFDDMWDIDEIIEMSKKPDDPIAIKDAITITYGKGVEELKVFEGFFEVEYEGILYGVEIPWLFQYVYDCTCETFHVSGHDIDCDCELCDSDLSPDIGDALYFFTQDALEDLDDDPPNIIIVTIPTGDV